MARRGLMGDVNPDVLNGDSLLDRAAVRAAATADAFLLRGGAQATTANGAPLPPPPPPPRPDGMLQCQRRGCGALYTAESNRESSCVFHPGAPVVSGAAKQWSCCGAHGATFSEFAALRGCMQDAHTQEAEPPDAQRPLHQRPDKRVGRLMARRDADDTRATM